MCGHANRHLLHTELRLLCAGADGSEGAHSLNLPPAYQADGQSPGRQYNARPVKMPRRGAAAPPMAIKRAERRSYTQIRPEPTLKAAMARAGNGAVDPRVIRRATTEIGISRSRHRLRTFA